MAKTTKKQETNFNENIRYIRVGEELLDDLDNMGHAYKSLDEAVKDIRYDLHVNEDDEYDDGDVVVVFKMVKVLKVTKNVTEIPV